MKKLSVFLFVCFLTFFFTACGQEVVSSPESSISPTSSLSEPSELESSSSAISSEPSDASESAESSDRTEESTPSEDTPDIGGEDICPIHKLMYHSYDNTLINYVGEENAFEWGASLPYIGWETMNIVDFVNHFQIPKETFIELTRSGLDDEFLAEYDGVTVYSMEMINAIYSGDQKQINKAFCGPLALVGPEDGELYSIYWLADHNADDYLAAGLPLDQVQTVVELAQTEEYADWNYLGKAAEATLAEAEAIEAGTGCGSTLKEKYSFHYYNVDGSLIDFIGADTFDAWWKKNKGLDLSILNVVRDFQIPKETFLSVTRPKLDEQTLTQLRSQGITLEEWYPYTLEEIDAIYSGEEATVNRVFCSPIAVFNETNGQIYTLRWLASHTAEEYQSVGLSSQAIQEVLNRIQSDDEYAEWRTLAEQVEPFPKEEKAIETQ